MKKHLLELLIISLLCGCSKGPTVIPDTSGVSTANNTGTNTGTGTTTGTTNGTDTSTGTGTSGGTPRTVTHININTAGGNGNFDAAGVLKSIQLSDANISTDFATIYDVTVNAVTTLEHADNMVLDTRYGAWGANFPNYSASDTTRQPYIREIVTDANKNVIEYRVYIVGIYGVLFRYETILPKTMTKEMFIASFATNNTQKVIKAKP